MVEFKCIGHDSRKQHACRSLCWRREGGFLWEEIGSFSYLDVQLGKKSGFFLVG